MLRLLLRASRANSETTSHTDKPKWAEEKFQQDARPNGSLSHPAILPWLSACKALGRIKTQSWTDREVNTSAETHTTRLSDEHQLAGGVVKLLHPGSQVGMAWRAKRSFRLYKLHLTGRRGCQTMSMEWHSTGRQTHRRRNIKTSKVLITSALAIKSHQGWTVQSQH